MSIVVINAVAVPPQAREGFEARFAARAAKVEDAAGFEGFELLRPAEGQDQYYVYTRWESRDAFNNWRNSQEFDKAHAPDSKAPVGTDSSVLHFEVVFDVQASSS
ncbi:MAG: antibiotic biosynthesis monooxygenase [Acidobacteria bacterium]|nr:antibiotic biosynthesis monooxygenase [Acidobacteriota bacterium]